MSTHWSSSLESLFDRDDTEIPLFEAALIFASHLYQNLNTTEVMVELDRLRIGLKERVLGTKSFLDRLSALNEFLFVSNGFEPNRDDYFDPRNSCMNEVLSRRTGIPISLSILYIELGRFIDLNLSGVCFPGHFLVRCDEDDQLIFIDVFSKGQFLSWSDLQEALRKNRGGEVSPAIVSSLVAPSTNRAILTRFLQNLRAIYMERGDHEKSLVILNWIIEFGLVCAEDHLNRAKVCEGLGATGASIIDYERSLLLEPGQLNAEQVKLKIAELRKIVQQVN